jgi:hypothetical protein
MRLFLTTPANLSGKCCSQILQLIVAEFIKTSEKPAWNKFQNASFQGTPTERENSVQLTS